MEKLTEKQKDMILESYLKTMVSEPYNKSFLKTLIMTTQRVLRDIDKIEEELNVIK